MESYISCDGKDVMATIVRNESHLRKRAKISRVTLIPAISMGFPAPSELHYQCCVNEEFLARRLKRRYFQQHLEHRGEYQDFLEAAQAHLDARVALNSSIFNVQGSSQAITLTGNGQGAAPPTVRTLAVDSSTQADDIEDAAVRLSHPSPPFSSESESDDSSGTITASRPQTLRASFLTISSESDDSSMTIRLSLPQAPGPPSPVVSSESDNSAEWVTGSRPLINGYRRVHQAHYDLQFVMGLDIGDEDRRFIESREEGGESFRLAGLDDGEAQAQEIQGQDQFAEWSGLVGELSDEWAKRGRSRPDPPQTRISLDSPEGIARLADIRLFLGMRPDTKSLDIWNFATRNNDLMTNITGGTLPIRHRHLGQAKRPGFHRDPGLDTVSDFADDKWELRKGFVDVWNSLNWTFEALSGRGPDVPRSPTDENDGGSNESPIYELYRALNVDDFIAKGVNIDDLNVGDEIEQIGTYKQEKEDEQKTFPLEGRCARIAHEVDFGGRLRAPRHQARNASRLRMSWTYADPENPDSSPDPQDKPVSPLSLPPTSPTLQDEPVSPLSSPPTSPTSQDIPVSRLFLSPLPRLIVHDDAIPLLSLEDSGPTVETKNRASSALSREEPESSGATDDSSSSVSISPRVFERKPLPTLIQADSNRGKRLLSDIRRLQAMPDSKTPQEISLFIDLHPELMKAIRTGHVPICQSPTTTNKKKLRQQNTQAIFDPLRTLRARKDRKHRFIQANLAMALKLLDWEQINSEPIPFTPSSPWDEGFFPPAEENQVDDDDEEECDTWVQTTVSPELNRLTKIDKKFLIKHQVKKPSPLRTTFTKREPGEEATSNLDKSKEGTAPAQGDLEEETSLFQDDSEEETSTTPSEPEIWEDVDLTLQESDR